jgi:hypothetical protein
MPRFLAEGIWEIHKPTDKDSVLVKSMKTGDRIAIKAAYTRKRGLPFDNRGQTVSVMAIKAVGTITGDEFKGSDPFVSPYSTMQHAMFLVMKEIRGRSAMEVARLLAKRLAAETETFMTNDSFSLHGMNGRQIHRMLARITDYIETCSGMASRYSEYVQRKGKNGYEIEHIWANHPEWHKEEFGHSSEFEAYRNRIGDLLLLPKSFNASYGDLPYKKKRDHYLKQILLAQSLHEKAYERNPGFKRFIKASGLSFRAHHEFTKADIDFRQSLYRSLAQEIWNPARLENEAIA